MEQLIQCSGALMVLLLVLLLDGWKLADCYDPLDPDGNITVTVDILQWTNDGYMARATIQNYYQYRHIEKPGWGLGWTWANEEIILSMAGAVVTKQGDCSAFNLDKVPYSCRRDPVIIDRTPDAAGENWTANCCHGGILSARAIDRSNSFSSFHMNIGNVNNNSALPPANLTLLAPGGGYTCEQLQNVPPTVEKVDGGTREEQAFRTWKSACTYSPFVKGNTTSCCVSLSAFYNQDITPCPTCSCSCQNKTCHGGREVRLSTSDAEKDEDSDNFNLVECTDHMCPVQVHWHVKANYREKWRVKVTISNYRSSYNYSDWNLVLQHPSLAQPIRTYSFNSTRLTSVGKIDDAVVFWGLDYYNSELPQAGEEGPSYVTSDIFIDKEDSFTLKNGWVFPRAVEFNGEHCVMPLPDLYPRLPNASSSPMDARCFLFFLLSLLLLFY